MPTITEKRRKFIINIIYWALILALIFAIFKYALPLFMPFCLALLCALIVQPAIRFLHKKLKIGKKISGIIALIIFYIIVFGALFGIALRAVKGVVDMVEMLPGFYTTTIEPALRGVTDRLNHIADDFDPSVQAFINTAVPQLISSIGSAVSGLATTVVGWVSGIAAKFPALIVSFFMFLIGSIFITLDYDRIALFLYKHLPEKSMKVVSGIKNHFFTVILKYGLSYLLIMLITFAELSIGLLIIGVKQWVLIGALIAVLDIFPIVGSGTVLIPWCIISFVLGDTSMGLSLMVLYILITAIRQLIEPKIIGQHVGLHPIVTLMSMYVGSKLFGVLGLFGLPISIVIAKDLKKAGTISLSHAEKSETETIAETSQEETEPDSSEEKPEE